MQAFYFLYLKNKEDARVKPSDGKLGIYRQPINTHYYSCCWGQKLYSLEVFFFYTNAAWIAYFAKNIQ